MSEQLLRESVGKMFNDGNELMAVGQQSEDRATDVAELDENSEIDLEGLRLIEKAYIKEGRTGEAVIMRKIIIREEEEECFLQMLIEKFNEGAFDDAPAEIVENLKNIIQDRLDQRATKQDGKIVKEVPDRKEELVGAGV